MSGHTIYIPVSRRSAFGDLPRLRLRIEKSGPLRFGRLCLVMKLILIVKMEVMMTTTRRMVGVRKMRMMMMNAGWKLMLVDMWF